MGYKRLVIILGLVLSLSACGSYHYSESISTVNGITEASITENEHFIKIYIYNTEEDIDKIFEEKVKQGFNFVIQNAEKSFDVRLNKNLFTEQEEFDLLNKFILGGLTETDTNRRKMIMTVKDWLKNREN